MVVLDNGHFFVVAAKENGRFALRKFAVGQMITQGITAGGSGSTCSFEGRLSVFERGESPPFSTFSEKGWRF